LEYSVDYSISHSMVRLENSQREYEEVLVFFATAELIVNSKAAIYS